MRQHIERIDLEVPGQGLHDITPQVDRAVQASGVEEGLATIFLRHTSASLVIQENADPSARRDLESYLARLVPEGDPRYTHTTEGPDDMPAHIKAALTHTSEQIPVLKGRLDLGTWQGLFLWEHRRSRGRRQITVHVVGE